MKIKTLICMICVMTVNVLSQWQFEANLPHDSSFVPVISQIMVIDSTVSWVLGSTNRNPNPDFPYFAKRSKLGWRELVNTNLNSNIKARCFCAKDSLNVWLGTFYPEEIYYSSDGGVNWTLQCHISDTAYVEGITFNNIYTNLGYAYADIGHNGMFSGIRILKTTDNGQNWSNWAFEMNGFSCSQGSLSIIDSNYAWFGAVNLSGGVNKIIMTSNGGINWNTIDIVSGMMAPIGLQFSDDKQIGLYTKAATPSFIYRTTNSGYNWTSVYTFGYYYYSESMRWVHGSTNIYSNDQSSVIHSTDGGLTWHTMYGATGTFVNLDAVKLNNYSIYALLVMSDRQVYKLLDTARLIGINNSGSSIPTLFALHQNYPNPFNPTTKIKYDIPKASQVNINVYDILGREVATLVHETKQPGYYEVEFNGTNLASGIYFYKMEVRQVDIKQNYFSAIKKLVLLK